MSLGADQAICATRLKTAMHDILEQQKAGSGANVDLPQVKPSFDGLGMGVFSILTMDAEVVTSPAFWQWLSQLGSWITQMQAWHVGVKAAVTAWAPTSATDIQLRSAILALADPAPPGIAPPAFQGKIT
jgi:hypothetical protein